MCGGREFDFAVVNGEDGRVVCAGGQRAAVEVVGDNVIPCECYVLGGHCECFARDFFAIGVIGCCNIFLQFQYCALGVVVGFVVGD